jgi:hypothetical protein
MKTYEFDENRNRDSVQQVPTTLFFNSSIITTFKSGELFSFKGLNPKLPNVTIWFNNTSPAVDSQSLIEFKRAGQLVCAIPSWSRATTAGSPQAMTFGNGTATVESIRFYRSDTGAQVIVAPLLVWVSCDEIRISLIDSTSSTFLWVAAVRQTNKS